MPMATPEPSTDRMDSLPLIDLRLLSQSELYTLSLSGATHRHRRSNDDDSVIPKIDRSIFNESAGSRKQTYSKLRLNKQKQNSTVPASSFHIPLHIPEPVDEENSQIITLLQQLFGVESLRNAPRNDAEDRRLVPVQVEFKQPPPESVTFQNVPIDVVDSAQRKRKRGRPRKNENSLTVSLEEPMNVNGNGEGEGNAVVAANETGFVVDAVRLDEDPFGEELKRRTQGLETEAQLLEFLETLNGEWASQRKKRRIVPASDLGDLLPTGWKIVLTLLKRAGRASVVCRRYVSPGGHQFESCKEVSAYLLSVSGVQDRSHLNSSYTDGAQQLSSSMNMASGSSVGHVPTGDMKTDADASYLSLAGASIHSSHEKQGPISSSIGSGNFKSDLALGCKLGDITGGAFTDLDHQTEDKQLLKADKNDGNLVPGCSLVEDRVRNVCTEKLVGATEASDAACNLYIPLVFSTSFSNNNSDNGQFSDEINAATCIKGGISNFAIEDRNTGCFETVPCGNEQAHVDKNGLGLSVKLVEENIQKIGFESSMLAPNSEGKIFAGENLEDRHLISSLEDMEIRDGKAIKDDQQQIICSRDQAEIKDVSTNVKLQSSSEGCSHVSSQNELKHTSISNVDRTQTSILKDSAEENIFDSDLFSSSIDERTHVHSGYMSNVSFSSCTQDASEYGGFDFASDLKLTKDVSDNHILSNEEAVARCLQERSSLNDQNSMMDNLLHRSSQSNLFALTGNQHPSAFHDNVNNISVGTFDGLKAVDAGCLDPQLGIISCSNIAVDAYTTASIMQGKSQGCVSVPLGESILNFEKRSDDGVNKANKSCLPEKAQNEVGIFQTDSMGLPKFRSAECAGNHKALLVYSQFPIEDDKLEK
ncbi:Methyl-CpG-binding domain-containing protein 8, partial [Mucuna pruriens]